MAKGDSDSDADDAEGTAGNGKAKGPRLASPGTVLKPCLIGVALLTLVNAVLPRG